MVVPSSAVVLDTTTAVVVGTVEGLFGTKVGGAVVRINGFTTSTSSSGTFSLNVPAGSYTIEIEHWLYETYGAPLEISSLTTYDLGKIQLSFKRAIIGAGAGIVAGLAVAAILVPRRGKRMKEEVKKEKGGK